MKRATAKKQLPTLLNRHRKKLAAQTKLRNRKPNHPSLPEVQKADHNRKLKAAVKVVRAQREKITQELDDAIAAQTAS